MTPDEYQAHMAYEANTVACRDEDSGRTYTIADLRSLFDMYACVDHWKGPIDVIVDADTVDVVGFTRAIEWFQGDRPKVTNGGAPTTLRVTSRGYRG